MDRVLIFPLLFFFLFLTFFFPSMGGRRSFTYIQPPLIVPPELTYKATHVIWFWDKYRSAILTGSELFLAGVFDIIYHTISASDLGSNG